MYFRGQFFIISWGRAISPTIPTPFLLFHPRTGFACMLVARNQQDLSLHVNIFVLLLLTAIVINLKVVVYEGAIREKPASKEEAWEFIKGLLSILSTLFPCFLLSRCFLYLFTWSAGYSGGHAATVGSVLVTNLKTGFRKGEWDRVEVLFALSFFN